MWGIPAASRYEEGSDQPIVAGVEKLDETGSDRPTALQGGVRYFFLLYSSSRIASTLVKIGGGL